VLALSELGAGTKVEVEYNFDVNTAKRHAVSVKVAVPASEASAAPTGSSDVAPAAAMANEAAQRAPVAAVTPDAAAPSTEADPETP
jgi:hypothetical protein